MDNEEEIKSLLEGAQRLGVGVDPLCARRLLHLRALLLQWNARVNLTSIVDPAEIVEKHFLDSLAVLPDLGSAGSVLDLGTGAGFPGLPLKLARPELKVTMVDTVAKKIGFVKQAIAVLGLAPGARALHLRAQGKPSEEGLELHDVVVSRALMDLSDWLPLARAYVAPGGRVLAMLGKTPPREQVDATADVSGLRCTGLKTYALPFSKAERALAVFQPRAG